MDGAAYLKQVRHGFQMYKSLGEKAMAQVPADTDFDVMLDETSNSIAILVQHLSGNFKSRYRDFLTTDGEKPDRDRDGEFASHGPSTRDGLTAMWNDGFAVVFAALDSLTPEDLDRTITIRNEPMSVVAALERSVTHLAYHVGQIVYLSRHFAFTAGTWTSLSISKGKSADFNKGMR
jgi:hypothetical protein